MPPGKRLSSTHDLSVRETQPDRSQFVIVDGPRELQALPQRTRESDLSDDELLLFDMMFDCNASASQMSSSAYAAHMNCDYNHSLDDAALHETIASLLSRKLIRSIGNTANSMEWRYALSDSGGKLWELERQPDWQRYITTTQKELGNFPAGSIVALCADEQIGRQCLGSMYASGIITPAGAIQTRQMYGKRLVPWKIFPSVFAVRCRTSDSINHAPQPVEWEVYESSRCWWRTIAELQTLRRFSVPRDVRRYPTEAPE